MPLLSRRPILVVIGVVMKTIHFLALVAAGLVACSSTSPSSSHTDGGAPGSDSASGGCATPDPITGTWKGVSITCNGNPPPAPIQAALAPPNSYEYVFTTSSTGSQVTGTASNGASCMQSIPLTFTYPSHGTLAITEGGTISCSPAGCSPECGTAGGNEVTYSYVLTGTTCDQLVLTSTDENPICTNPVVITATRE
jgi:hypothetical protein